MYTNFNYQQFDDNTLFSLLGRYSVGIGNKLIFNTIKAELCTRGHIFRNSANIISHPANFLINAFNVGDTVSYICPLSGCIEYGRIHEQLFVGGGWAIRNDCDSSIVAIHSNDITAIDINDDGIVE